MAEDIMLNDQSTTGLSKVTIHGKDRYLYVDRIVLEYNSRTKEVMFNVDFRLSYMKKADEGKDGESPYINAPFQGMHVVNRYNSGVQRANHYQLLTHSQFSKLCQVCDVKEPPYAVLKQRLVDANQDHSKSVIYTYGAGKSAHKFACIGTVVQDPQALNDHSGHVHPELAGWVNIETLRPMVDSYDPNTENEGIQEIRDKLAQVKENVEKKEKAKQTQTAKTSDNDLDR